MFATETCILTGTVPISVADTTVLAFGMEKLSVIVKDAVEGMVAILLFAAAATPSSCPLRSPFFRLPRSQGEC